MNRSPESIRISHLIDDHETVRTHPVRTLRDQDELLSNALHAIVNGRTDVALEFVERVRDALAAEVAWLADRKPTGVDGD
jgi:hypothetical protein